MSEKKDTIRRLSEQSQSVAKKTLDTLEETRVEVIDRLRKACERAGVSSPRTNSHSDLPAVTR
ncbi:MAG: hypothetical protein JNM17_13180 [Archangium sp.]|nr:hypothetical protein [Archangium sp.]